jgi:hypothetical protein
MDFIKRHIVSQIAKEINTINFDRTGYLFMKNPVKDKNNTIIKLSRWGFPYCGVKGYTVSWDKVEARAVYKVLKEIKKGNYFTIGCPK